MTGSIFQRCFIDTAAAAPDQRVRYWEDQCRDNLVSFRCTSHADEGLVANHICLDMAAVRVGRTGANAHVIERTPEMIRSFPRESIFVNLILAGETFFYQRGHCAKLQRGDVLLYDARYPYLVGGASHFDLLHIDITAADFHARLGRTEIRQPIQLGNRGGTAQLYRRTLSRWLLDLLEGPAVPRHSPEALCQQVCELLRLMMGQADGSSALSALSAGHLLAARAFIDEHLGDESLHAERVAAGVGISERHLRRLFAAQGVSLADHLLARRLEQARQDLLDPRLRRCTVAETAYRCGFASHAHFSRAFKLRFGTTPSEAQRSAAH